MIITRNKFKKNIKLINKFFKSNIHQYYIDLRKLENYIDIYQLLRTKLFNKLTTFIIKRPKKFFKVAFLKKILFMENLTPKLQNQTLFENLVIDCTNESLIKAKNLVRMIDNDFVFQVVTFS